MYCQNCNYCSSAGTHNQSKQKTGRVLSLLHKSIQILNYYHQFSPDIAAQGMGTDHLYSWAEAD